MTLKPHRESEGVFLLKTMIAIIPVKHVYSVNIYVEVVGDVEASVGK